VKVRELMTKNPVAARPDASLHDVASLMKQHDCGCLPVEDPQSHRLLGVVTDRDIVTRAIAEGKDGDTTAQDIMSKDPSCCTPEDDVRAAEKIMADKQVRRVPVVDRTGRVLGMLAQADLARAPGDGADVTRQEVAQLVERISEKTRVQH
jgi:CBS domain-containing protein